MSEAPKRKTLEEIARDLHNRGGVSSCLNSGTILAALREAADAARQEEREALRKWLGDGSKPYAELKRYKVHRWLDSRKDQA